MFLFISLGLLLGLSSRRESPEQRLRLREKRCPTAKARVTQMGAFVYVQKFIRGVHLNVKRRCAASFICLDCQSFWDKELIRSFTLFKINDFVNVVV